MPGPSPVCPRLELARRFPTQGACPRLSPPIECTRTAPADPLQPAGISYRRYEAPEGLTGRTEHLGSAIAALLLTATGDSGTAVFLIDGQPTDAQAQAMKAIEDKGIPVWRCDIAEGRPALPPRWLRTSPTEAGVGGRTAP
ncbi:MAG: hypothetical protein IOC94_15860 [Methylocystis sp.]|nr:hypothetical protein [Methylocystis sp.]